MNLLNNTYKDFDLDYFLQKCKQYQFPLDKKINEFSTGMKTKLNVLIALSHHASFLILDEPTNGLDVLAREEIIDLIREFMEEDENRSVLISSHISSDLEGLCDDIYMIDDGKFIFHETTDCLLDQYGLLKLTEEQFNQVDHNYFIKTRKENYGYTALTNQKQFYQENYPEIIIEKNNFDTLFSMMLRVNKMKGLFIKDFSYIKESKLLFLILVFYLVLALLVSIKTHLCFRLFQCISRYHFNEYN